MQRVGSAPESGPQRSPALPLVGRVTNELPRLSSLAKLTAPTRVTASIKWVALRKGLTTAGTSRAATARRLLFPPSLASPVWAPAAS